MQIIFAHLRSCYFRAAATHDCRSKDNEKKNWKLQKCCPVQADFVKSGADISHTSESDLDEPWACTPEPAIKYANVSCLTITLSPIAHVQQFSTTTTFDISPHMPSRLELGMRSEILNASVAIYSAFFPSLFLFSAPISIHLLARLIHSSSAGAHRLISIPTTTTTKMNEKRSHK